MNSKRSLSRAEKSLYIFSTTAILLFVGIAVFNSSRNRDVPLDFSTPATRPNPNGYDLYVAAAKATVRLKPEHDQASDTTLLTPNSPAFKQRYSLARRKAWLKRNGKMLALFNQAKHTPTMSLNMRDDFNQVSGNYTILRQLIRDNSSIARMYQMENRPYAATQTAFDGMQMGTDISQNGTLINRLVAIAIIAISRSVLEDWGVTINQLNATEAKAAAVRLEKIISQQPKREDILEEERWVYVKYVQKLMKAPNWRLLGASAGLRDRLSIQFIRKQRIISDMNRHFDESIARIKLPYSQRNTPIFIPSDPIGKTLAPDLSSRFQMNESRANVGLDLLLLRLALRAYKVEKGAYPASLAALTPKYLKAIPTDDYGDDKPYFYRLKNGNYELWSVGANGKNDNGKPLAARNSNSSNQASDLFQEEGDFVAGINR